MKRNTFVKQMVKLLKSDGKLAGLWLDFLLTDDLEKRHFGGTKELCLKYWSLPLETKTFERCYNSIPPRIGQELFRIFRLNGNTKSN